MLTQLALHELSFQREASLCHDTFSSLQSGQNGMRAIAEIAEFHVPDLKFPLFIAHDEDDVPIGDPLDRIIGNNDTLEVRRIRRILGRAKIHFDKHPNLEPFAWICDLDAHAPRPRLFVQNRVDLSDSACDSVFTQLG